MKIRLWLLDRKKLREREREGGIQSEIVQKQERRRQRRRSWGKFIALKERKRWRDSEE